MANTFKNAALANVNHSAYATLYTAPSSTQVVVLGMAIANKSSQAVTVKVQFTDSSASTFTRRAGASATGGTIVPAGCFTRRWALGLLGSLPAEVSAPAAVLASASAFLRRKQSQTGSFGVDRYFSSEQALAAYALHAQAPATLRRGSVVYGSLQTS